MGGDRTVRLFTTRQRGVLPDSTVTVRVDQVFAAQARATLTADLPPYRPRWSTKHARVCGSWPLLLSLVHGVVRDAVEPEPMPLPRLRVVLDALRSDGITALDVTDPDARGRAVARTIEVSLDRLTSTQRDRYLELAVFGEDVTIPGEVAARLWAHTGGWSAFTSRLFCQRLADLALLAGYRRTPDRLQLHDVIRRYLVEHTAALRAQLHRTVIEAHRDLVPECGGRDSWADLASDQTYLWTWLASHLHDGGLTDELRALLDDPRWIASKLDHAGPAGLETDLLHSAEPRHRALATLLRQDAHILGHLDPPGSLTATLASRLPAAFPNPHLRAGLLATLTGPHLTATTELPDLPHPSLTRVLTGHTGAVEALAVARDGTSGSLPPVLTAPCEFGTPVTGLTRHTLTGHTDMVRALAVAS